MADVHVTGMKEIAEAFQRFPVKFEKNTLRRGMRRGMNVVKPVAQRGVRSISGKLARGLKVGTRVKGGAVIATLKATGPHAFVAHMLEFTGAKPHQITAKQAKALSIGGRAYRSVPHPGFKKRPFMRPALDQTASQVVLVIAQYCKAELETKGGIDVSYINIAGDE